MSPGLRDVSELAYLGTRYLQNHSGEEEWRIDKLDVGRYEAMMFPISVGGPGRLVSQCSFTIYK